MPRGPGISDLAVLTGSGLRAGLQPAKGTTVRRRRLVVRQFGAAWMVAVLAFVLTACAGSSPGRSAPTQTADDTRAALRLVATFAGHAARVTSVAWSPDGAYVVSASLDRTARVWDATSSAAVETYPEHADTVLAAAWSPADRLIASGDSGGTLRVWRALTGATVFASREHGGPITTLAWSPDGRAIATGSQDATVRVWDAASGTVRQTFRGHTAGVRAVAWSPGGALIASAGDDGTVQVWDAASGATRLVYRGHAAPVTSLAWSPDGTYIASGSLDKTAQVWNAATGAALYTYHGYRVDAPVSDPLRVLPDQVFGVPWSHDGKRLAVLTQEYCGDECSVVLIWDALTQANVRLSPSATIFALAWSPDDTRLAASVGDARVEIFAAG